MHEYVLKLSQTRQKDLSVCMSMSFSFNLRFQCLHTSPALPTLSAALRPPILAGKRHTSRARWCSA